MITKTHGLKLNLGNLEFQGPWGDNTGNSGGNSGQGGFKPKDSGAKDTENKDSWKKPDGNNSGPNKKPADFDDFVKKIEDFFNGLFGNKKNGSGRNPKNIFKRQVRV